MSRSVPLSFLSCLIMFSAAGQPSHELPMAPGVNFLSVAASGQSSVANPYGSDREAVRIGNGDATFDVNEEIDLIVRFKSPPLGHLTKKQTPGLPDPLMSARARIENEHSQLIVDLQRIEMSTLSNRHGVLQSANIKVRFDYRTALNGMALRTRRWMLGYIKSLPYVKSVDLDTKVNAVDEISNHVVGADSVWEQFGIQGDGITIGILDTGIDYMHPDLGGGLGSTFKVIGGYDFVNSDSDPMDDHYHGTHVAGIAAADGATLKGVAPHARLLAVKVLAQSGGGSSSTVIAGIDYALDPDGNPATSDAVDVINMSLTDPYGDPTDPLAEAADGAVMAGVVTVIAAGNAGPNNLTIGSPAAAELALTVGAADNLDNVASFSSRGPVRETYALKPELLAPGVGISSTMPGGGWASLNGTSMASPHVAGVAALLLQLHSTWSPMMVKSVLLNKSKRLGNDLFTEGTGRVDAKASARSKAVMVPGAMNVGFDDLAVSAWARIDTFWITNASPSSLNYSLMVGNSNFPAGVGITFAPSSVELSPGAEQVVLVQVTVDNAVVPNLDIDIPPFVYRGEVLAISESDTLRSLLSFVKTPILTITVSPPPDYYYTIYLHNHVKRVWVNAHNLSAYSIPLKQGIYDIMVFGGGLHQDPWSFIVKEDINVNGAINMNISPADAPYELEFRPLDENGSLIDVTQSKLLFSLNALEPDLISLLDFNGFLGSPYPRRYINVSSMSSKYRVSSFVMTAPDERKVYNLYSTTKGISGNVVLTAESQNLRHFFIRYHLDALDEVRVLPWFGVDKFSASGIKTAENILPLASPFVQEVYSSQTDTSFRFVYWRDVMSSDLVSRLTTPSFVPRPNGGIECYYLWDSYYRAARPNLVTQEDTIHVGLSPVHWAGKFEVWDYAVLLRTDAYKSIGASHYPASTYMNDLPLFRFQFQDFPSRISTVSNPPFYPFRLLLNETIIDEGLLGQRIIYGIDASQIFDHYYYFYLTTPGAYRLEVSDTSTSLYGRKVSAEVSVTFDNSAQDRTPPVLGQLNVLADGKHADWVLPGQEGLITLAVSDDVNLGTVSLLYHTEGDPTWVPLTVGNEGGLYTAVIPAGMPEEFVSLRVLASDNSGNSISYSAEPAFYFGNNPLPIQLSAFWAQPHGSQAVLLQWTTISETNNYGFEIQRSTNQPNQFSILPNGFVAGHGTTVEPQHYSFIDSTLDAGAVQYRLKQIDLDGAVHYTEPIQVSGVTSVKESSIPTTFSLAQNFPNPFNPSTTIRYGLPRNSPVRLTVFNALGQQVTVLVQGEFEAGYHEVKFDASELSSGVYFYRLQAGDFVQTCKLLLLR